jgi:hypothetical protein
LMYPNSSSMEITSFSFIYSLYANILLFVTRTSTTKIHPTQLSSMVLSIENPSTHNWTNPLHQKFTAKMFSNVLGLLIRTSFTMLAHALPPYSR